MFDINRIVLTTRDMTVCEIDPKKLNTTGFLGGVNEKFT